MIYFFNWLFYIACATIGLQMLLQLLISSERKSPFNIIAAVLSLVFAVIIFIQPSWLLAWFVNHSILLLSLISLMNFILLCSSIDIKYDKYPPLLLAILSCSILLLYPNMHITFWYGVSAFFSGTICIASYLWLIQFLIDKPSDRIQALTLFSFLVIACFYYLHICHPIFLHNAINFFINRPLVFSYFLGVVAIAACCMIVVKHEDKDQDIDHSFTTYALVSIATFIICSYFNFSSLPLQLALIFGAPLLSVGLLLIFKAPSIAEDEGEYESVVSDSKYAQHVSDGAYHRRVSGVECRLS